jgi:hypothetical protein
VTTAVRTDIDSESGDVMADQANTVALDEPSLQNQMENHELRARFKFCSHLLVLADRPTKSAEFEKHCQGG